VDLGYTYSQPQIFRLNDGNYYVAVGNGYNNTEADGHQSSTGEAVLYLLNVVTGAVVKKITTGYGTSKDPSKDPLKEPLNNGLATVKGYDAGTSTAGDIGGAADGKIDFIYAGDLFGNLWKFDLSSVDPNDWGYIAEEDVNNDLEPQRNPMKLFSAKDSDDNPQPITVQPAVHTLNSGQIMVYFGTGKLLEYADTQAVNISPQSFYAIADESSITARSELLEQKILYQGTISFDGITKEVRATTENTRTTHKGWFIDLKKPVYDASNQLSHIQEGEQIVVGARVLDNVVYFVTNFADQDPCLSPINKNFLMSFSVKSGAPLDEVLIDIDEDGVMDADDKFSYINEAGESINAVVSGSTGFGSQLPTFVKTGDVKNDGSEIGFMIDKDGKMVKMQSTSKVWNRLSWREIRTE
jgi:type IV pilus assembly protein PilY1